MNETMRIAFMPIKPIYADKIIDGSKKFEFRRASIKGDLTHLIIYASSPVKRIIGIAVVDGVDISPPLEAWGNTKHAAGISRVDFLNYFQGKEKAVTIKFKDILPLGRDVCPKEIEAGFKVPQSFKYVQSSFLQDVLTKGDVVAA
jgi:predicted transcriptional regulator